MSAPLTPALVATLFGVHTRLTQLHETISHMLRDIDAAPSLVPFPDLLQKHLILQTRFVHALHALPKELRDYLVFPQASFEGSESVILETLLRTKMLPGVEKEVYPMTRDEMTMMEIELELKRVEADIAERAELHESVVEWLENSRTELFDGAIKITSQRRESKDDAGQVWRFLSKGL